MRANTIRLALLVLIVLMVSGAHYVTPTGRPELHALYRWFYHLPIILGAFWFGLRGGVGLSLFVSVMSGRSGSGSAAASAFHCSSA